MNLLTILSRPQSAWIPITYGRPPYESPPAFLTLLHPLIIGRQFGIFQHVPGRFTCCRQLPLDIFCLIILNLDLLLQPPEHSTERQEQGRFLLTPDLTGLLRPTGDSAPS